MVFFSTSYFLPPRGYRARDITVVPGQIFTAPRRSALISLAAGSSAPAGSRNIGGSLPAPAREHWQPARESLNSYFFSLKTTDRMFQQPSSGLRLNLKNRDLALAHRKIVANVQSVLDSVKRTHKPRKDITKICLPSRCG